MINLNAPSSGIRTKFHAGIGCPIGRLASVDPAGAGMTHKAITRGRASRRIRRSPYRSSPDDLVPA
jgi:hypothetical protein